MTEQDTVNPGHLDQMHSWWVVSNMFFLHNKYMGIILPIDELIFLKMVITPPTRMMLWLVTCSLVPVGCRK
jgi:hypothetical protein